MEFYTKQKEKATETGKQAEIVAFRISTNLILLIAADNVFVPMQKPVFAAIKDKMNRIFNLIA